jgi:putative ABC transport system substrate-binding protein
MTVRIRRRQLLAALSGAAVWPLAAGAQQAERMRRIGVLLAAADDPVYQTQLGAFLQALGQSGWIIGQNVGIDTRPSTTNAEVRRHAAELVALRPDIILVAGGTGAGALQQATRTVPIVFVNVTDPVGRGLVDSLARPGGNVTGFTPFEFHPHRRQDVHT